MATSGTTRDRVLIVLDDDRIAGVMEAAVERASYRPVVVPDAERARSLLEDGLEPCAVLLALGRTEDGREFARRHAADARTARIPIIFFTPATVQTRDSPIVAALVAFVRTHCNPSPPGGTRTAR